MLKAIPQLTIDNISILYRDIVNLIKTNKDVTLDLSHITEVDSSGIALICELKQFAKSQGAELNIHNPSNAFLRLCKLYKINLI